VDLECRISAKCAFFTQLMRESRKPEDSLAERGEFELSGDLLAVSKPSKHVRGSESLLQPDRIIATDLAALQHNAEFKGIPWLPTLHARWGDTRGRPESWDFLLTVASRGDTFGIGFQARSEGRELPWLTLFERS
jgi:hypothetical protein